MMSASILAEAIRAEEPIHVTRERLATRDHVTRHYRVIALPALAAATRRIAALRAMRNKQASVLSSFDQTDQDAASPTT